MGGRGSDKLVGSTLGGVLVGGDGKDKLYGVAGINVLIGGAGADTLIGGVGNDILIAGTTTYEHNTAALDAILASWSTPNATFNNIIKALRSGVGPKQQYSLGSATVPDHHSPDVLTGGIGRDWFWVASDDTITDRDSDPATGDQVN
jgi:Ca2+-binding RTX toxin-like protein